MNQIILGSYWTDNIECRFTILSTNKIGLILSGATTRGRTDEQVNICISFIWKKAQKIWLQTFLTPMQNLYFTGSRFESFSTYKDIACTCRDISYIYQYSIAKTADFIVQIFKYIKVWIL
jgi:hypothetical protein